MRSLEALRAAMCPSPDASCPLPALPPARVRKVFVPTYGLSTLAARAMSLLGRFSVLSVLVNPLNLFPCYISLSSVEVTAVVLFSM